MTTEFTPLASTAGGVLIGISAVLLMLSFGRIMGATGILSGAIFGGAAGGDRGWRLALLAGMITAPGVYLAASGGWPEIAVPMSTPLMLIGGVIVGMGVTWGSGCTSGHGVCGMARVSPRSIAATVTFMLTTGITVFLVRHVFGG